MALTVKGGLQGVDLRGSAKGVGQKGVCTVLLESVLDMAATEMENIAISWHTKTMSQ